MYDIVFNAHSGLRYLILLVAVIITVYALIGLPRKQTVDKTGLTLLRVFIILLDIQLLLGIAILLTGEFRGQQIGHLVVMIGAIAVAHLGLARLKKADPERRGYGVLLASALIPLVLFVAGILAIQRPII